MATIPTLSDEQISERVGEQSFQRGRRYANDGAIFETFQQGAMLKAQCAGSRDAVYRLWVAFDDTGIAAADCSCPVGAGGHCKHIAVLLLTWREHPDDFVTLEDLDTVLNRRDKSDLIALIKQMVLRDPDLELLVQTPLPAAGRREEPIDPDIYYRHAIAAFRRGGHEWGAEKVIGAELEKILAIGDGFMAQQDHVAAAAVYMTVATAVAENVQMYGDEDGALRGVVARCIAGMGQSLDVMGGDSSDGADQAEITRAMLLRTLFDLYRCGVDGGGIGFAEDAPDALLAHISGDERGAVEEWARQASAASTGDQWSSEFRRKAYGGLLLDLEMQTLDDEAFLRLCREIGRGNDLLDRLLALGRVDEAVEELRGVGDYQLYRLTDLFARHGQEEAIERVMLERSKKTDDARVLGWLKDRCIARGDHAAALELARKIFRIYPSLEAYQQVRELATRRDRWEAIRPTLRMLLNESPHKDLLPQIYLDDGEIDHALAALKEQPHLLKPDWVSYDVWENSALKVATAAEATRPRQAMEIYQTFAEGLIELQGRQHYRMACELLCTARGLYKQLGEEAEWSRYITALREQNRRLRALMQEMEAAGLTPAPAAT